MGGKCCSSLSRSKDISLDEKLNFLDLEENWLRQNIDYIRNCQITESDSRKKTEILESMSKKLKILTSLSELSVCIKSTLDTMEDKVKIALEKHFDEILIPFIESYTNIKGKNFKEDIYINDFCSRVKVFVKSEKNILANDIVYS